LDISFRCWFGRIRAPFSGVSPDSTRDAEGPGDCNWQFGFKP